MIAGRRFGAGPRSAVILLALASVPFSGGCATTRHADATGLRIEVLTPVDGVPVRDDAVWLAGSGGVDVRRDETLRRLRHDLAEALEQRHARVCEGESQTPARSPFDPVAAARSLRGDSVEAVVAVELVAYGEVRRSWLWLLFGQGVLAGIGHGVAAAQLTGNPATGWWVGLGELALETVTWVGGALVASRWVDPVVVRVWAIRPDDGSVVGRWTLEGLRPFRLWFEGRRGRPRNERLKTVANRLFVRSAEHIAARMTRQRGPAPGHTERVR